MCARERLITHGDEQEEVDTNTITVFHALSSLGLTDKDTNAASEALEKEIRAQSPCVFQLPAFSMDGYQAKQSMIVAMMTYVYQKRVSTDAGEDDFMDLGEFNVSDLDFDNLPDEVTTNTNV